MYYDIHPVFRAITTVLWFLLIALAIWIARLAWAAIKKIGKKAYASLEGPEAGKSVKKDQ